MVSSSPRKTLWATASAPVSTVVDAGPWQEDTRVASPTDASLCLGGDTVTWSRAISVTYSPCRSGVARGRRGYGRRIWRRVTVSLADTSAHKALTHSREPRCPRKERITDAAQGIHSVSNILLPDAPAKPAKTGNFFGASLVPGFPKTAGSAGGVGRAATFGDSARLPSSSRARGVSAGGLASGSTRTCTVISPRWCPPPPRLCAAHLYSMLLAVMVHPALICLPLVPRAR